MKVTVDMENLGLMVQDVVEKNLNSIIENEVRKSIESKVAASAKEIIESVVNEKLESYVNDYIKTATISVGGGWNSDPKTYTVEEYIKQQISEIMNKQAFKTRDRYGDYKSTVTFEEYVKKENPLQHHENDKGIPGHDLNDLKDDSPFRYGWRYHECNPPFRNR